MNLIYSLLIATATALPQAKVETLSGQTHIGQIQELGNEHLLLNVSGKSLKLPTKKILSLSTKQEKVQVQSAPFTTTLLDGTRLKGNQITTAKRKINLVSPIFGEIVLPLEKIHFIQLKKSEGTDAATWEKLTIRELKQDIIVTKKNDRLDHFRGVIGNIGEKTVQFILNGKMISVKRKKVFGLIYARGSGSRSAREICNVSLLNGELIKLKKINLTEKGLESTLLSGIDIIIPFNQIKLMDFSLGKLLYLSQTEPREKEFTSFLGYEYSFRNNKNDAGQALKLDKTYSRGLWIHSKTELTYRISRKYRRFQAIIGIDRNLTNYRQGHVRLIIRGDNKVLFDQDVKGTDKPKAIDLSVEDVLDLTILVDFGPNGDHCDHLDLINAKVLK
ncbi:hypothetical protein MNBD_PLANCTO02-3375 [hydrothermal vent metagenome]|uniref:Glycosyl hydrolase family 98 putative carbohydrate-binding module domain-containing protein n=1 Tax=hydrothermal vent metagenome TaxID=652676 RepID=A0A3B1D3T9_9ZZZZ